MRDLVNDFRSEEKFQRRKQPGGGFFDDRLAGQRNDPCEICSRAGEARFDHEPFRAVGETNQRALVGNRDFGGIGNGRNHHAVGQHRRWQE